MIIDCVKDAHTQRNSVEYISSLFLGTHYIMLGLKFIHPEFFVKVMVYEAPHDLQGISDPEYNVYREDGS